MGMRTQKPHPKGPAEGGALGEGLLGPYAHRRGLRDRTGPPKRPRPPIRRTTQLAAAESLKTAKLRAHLNRMRPWSSYADPS